MYRILETRSLVNRIHQFRIAAPEVASKARAGQFCIIRVDENGERIPLTLADWDKADGSVTVVFMETGTTTTRLARLKAGDAIADLAGPLGNPTDIENFGTVILVSGGFAAATISPIARAMKIAGNTVYSIIGARSKDLLF